MLSVSVEIENLDPEVRPVLEWIEACRQEGKEIDYLEPDWQTNELRSIG